MNRSLAQALAGHLVSLRHEALPPVALDAAKRVMLDTLAVAWAGTDAEGAAAALATVREQGGTPQATVWGHGDRLPVLSSAFANGVFAAALDFDSHYLGVHSDGVVLPAALAVAERDAVNGRDFLTALAAANDVVCRLGRSARGAHRGWYYTTIFGIVGAAAATAKLLNLDADATCNALGLAVSQASGTQQPAVEHTLTMRFQAAFASRSGVLAGLLAAKGVTAPRHAFDGNFGFFALYQPGDSDSVVADLGRTFLNAKTAFKKYPCCACSHAAIEAARKLIADHPLAAESIKRVIVLISPDMDRLVGIRPIPGADPQVAAQFSVQYAVACALLTGGFSVGHLQRANILDGTLRSFMERVTVRVDPSLTGKFAPAEVVVIPLRGATLRCRIDTMPGTPDAPIDDDAFSAKLDDCFGSGAMPLDPARRRVLRQRILRLESLPRMDRLFDGIVDEEIPLATSSARATAPIP